MYLFTKYFDECSIRNYRYIITRVKTLTSKLRAIIKQFYNKKNAQQNLTQDLLIPSRIQEPLEIDQQSNYN